MQVEEVISICFFYFTLLILVSERAVLLSPKSDARVWRQYGAFLETLNMFCAAPGKPSDSEFHNESPEGA